MDNEGLTPSKIISFVLGIVVIIIIFSLVAGRLKLKDRIASLSSKKTTVTPSVTITPLPKTIIVEEIKVTPMVKQNKVVYPTQYVAQSKDGQVPYPTSTTSYTKGGVSSIPATGAPSLLLPLSFLGALSGMYLKRRS